MEALITEAKASGTVSSSALNSRPQFSFATHFRNTLLAMKGFEMFTATPMRHLHPEIGGYAQITGR